MIVDKFIKQTTSTTWSGGRWLCLLILFMAHGACLMGAALPQAEDSLNAQPSHLNRLAAFDSAYAAVDSLDMPADTLAASLSTEKPDSTIFDNPFYEPIERTAPLTINEDSLRHVYELSQRKLEGGIDPKDDPYFQRFNPQPMKAVWWSALFPGGGQIYNRKYWKLPIIYGGFLALIYGYNWNQRYYKTYANAYRDLVLESPNASYRQFLPPGYPVEQRRDYLEKVFKSKKNTYRNWRDYCVLGMIGVYLVAMVDAYVDASLYHFDISTDLGPDDKPQVSVGCTIDF